jgi:hypothetical protein
LYVIILVLKNKKIHKKGKEKNASKKSRYLDERGYEPFQRTDQGKKETLTSL